MRFSQKKKENSKKRVLRKWWIPGIVLVMIAVLMVVLFLPARQTETLEAVAEEAKSAPVAKTIEADYADLAYQNLLENTPDFDNLTAGEDYTDDEIIILFASDEEKAAVESALTESGAEKLEDISQNMALVKVPEGVSVADYYVALNDTLGEVAAQPNYIYHLLEDETQTNTKKNKSETKKTKEAPDEAPDAFGVTYLTEDMTITATPNDPQTYRQMYLDEIEAFTAWDEVDGFNSGDGVIVAIIDTGIDLDHPDLAANIVDGVCYTGENTTGQDNHGHGTHVAGIVAAVANNGTGVSGVAPGASLMAIKTMASDGYGSTTNIVRGIEYAVANGADIINMSIGALGYDGVLDSAVTYAKNNGVVVVCAAGNEGTDAPAWPSDAEDAISVISTGVYNSATSSIDYDTISSFSNYGAAKDISAPGYYIYSTKYDGTYVYKNGTSMASPVVSGVAALLLNADSSLSVDGVTQILYDSAEDLGDPGKDNDYGYGRVNANQAVMLARDIGDEGNAYPIQSGQTIESDIDPETDVDWFEFTAESDDVAEVVVEGLESQNLTVEILDDTMAPLVTTTPGISQSYTFSPNAGSVYYITIAGHDASMGGYRLIVYQDTVADTASGADTLESDVTFSSYIETSADTDAFLFQAETGALVTFSVAIPDGTKSAVLQVDDSSGTVYTGSAFYDADSFSVQATQGETYEVYLSSADETVPYTITCSLDTNGDDIASAVLIENGDKRFGALETHGDIDYFAFTPNTTGYYYFNTLGDMDTYLKLYDSAETLLAESDDIQEDFSVMTDGLTSGIYYELTQGETYYFAVSEFDGTETGDYAVSLNTDNPETEVAIPDTQLQNFLVSEYGLVEASTVPMCIMLIVEDISVDGLTDATGITAAKNLESLYIINSPGLNDLNTMGGLAYLTDAVFEVTSVSAFPDTMSEWSALESLRISEGHLTELPDWSAHANLTFVDVSGNYIDFSEDSVSYANAATMETAGITVSNTYQQSLGSVTLTFSSSEPQTYEDITLTAQANTPVDIGEGAEYLFEASLDGEIWEMIRDWGVNTTTWYADQPGFWQVRVTARVGGNTDDVGVSETKTVTAGDPDSISSGRVNIVSLSSEAVKPSESVTIYPEFDIDDLPERYAFEYRVLYSFDQRRWAVSNEHDWTEIPEAGLDEIEVTAPTITKDKVCYFVVEMRLKGVESSEGYDRSNTETLNIYGVMPMASVTLTRVGDDTASQAVTSAGIELEATALNVASYDETPTYRFSYRMQGSKKWVFINRRFSTENTITFVPRKEGTYYFRVEVASQGRRRSDVSFYDYKAYTLSKAAEPVKGVYNLTADKKDYLNAETVTLTMDIVQNTSGEDVEYQILYSTNGRNFRAFNREYQALTIDSGTAEVEVPTLPIVKRDTVYYLKIQVRTVGRNERVADAYNTTQVEFKTAYPVEDGEVDILQVGNDADEQSINETGITIAATERANTAYRFGYQKLGSTRWAYVAKGWSTENEIAFVPRSDGRYRFRVEAKSLSRLTTDSVSDATDYYGLYKATLGAVSASIATSEPAYIGGADGIEVPITYSAAGNGTDAYDIRFTYSLNGTRYRVIPGEDWQSAGTTALTDETKTLTLPATSRDRHYYIRVEVKTADHAAVDIYDFAEVDVYTVQPLTSIDSFTTDAESGIKTLAEITDGLMLTAAANDAAYYSFYYRLSGTTKWIRISNRYVSGGEAFFRPRKEGDYEFKVSATAEGRPINRSDVTAELGETIEIYFSALPAESTALSITDADLDYIIGQDNEMNLQITADGNTDAMEYRVLYSINGKRYSQLEGWQTLTTAGDGTYDVTCGLPASNRDRAFYIKAEVRSSGRLKADVESEPIEIWMLSEERAVETTLLIAGETYEYTEDITANISITEPVSGEVEYQIQYSINNKRWQTLSAHDWTAYDDGGTGSIDVNLDLTELNGETTAYIKVNARLQGGTKIEDFAQDSFKVYNIAPVLTANLDAVLSGEEYITLSVTADDGGYDHTKEYRYSYALAGRKKTVYTAFTSWVQSDSVTYTPSLTGDYLFKVEVRNQGRLRADITATASNNDSGYYLKSQEDIMAESLLELAPTPSPSPSASASASVEPSTSASPSASVSPSISVSGSASPSPSMSSSQTALPSVTPSESQSPEPSASIDSLEYALMTVLGEDFDISAYTEIEIMAEDIVGIMQMEQAPVIIAQTGEDTYAVIIDYEVGEEDVLIRLTLTDQTGEIILGGIEDVIRLWYYAPIEPIPSIAPSAVVSPTPSVSLTVSQSEAPTLSVMPSQ